MNEKGYTMIRERLGKELLYFDGGMGTLLQERGLEPGELPETWNLTHADEIRQIHRSYIEAGSDIILTNTFGANALKFHDDRYSLEEIVTSAVGHVRAAAETAGVKRPIYTALDIGPTGKLLKPMGDLDFETAYEAFKEVMICGEKAGADLIHIETMSDTYELKAAVLAAKENTSLPVFATTIFDERGKLLTGAGRSFCDRTSGRSSGGRSGDQLRDGTGADVPGAGAVSEVFLPAGHREAKCRASEAAGRPDLL